MNTRKLINYFLLSVSVLAFSACDFMAENETEVSGDQNQAEEKMEDKNQEEVADFQAEMEVRLAALDSEWESFKSELDGVAEVSIQEVDAMIESLEEDIDTLKNQSQSAWAQAKANVEADMNNLESKIDAAFEMIDSENENTNQY